tara:strand:- start:6656 stop:7102 length:447 start_codon:yes stop_codon:yes gene_type:complete
MSILNKLAALTTVTSSTDVPRVQMSEKEIASCKAAIRRDNRGLNVQPNRFDLSKPYRVAINYKNDWHNFGDFTSADVAAAVGTIVSSAFFGEKAKKGAFDLDKVEADPNFAVWMADPRNADVIARADDPEQSHFMQQTMPTKAVAQPF